jgi:hypothetical protein
MLLIPERGDPATMAGHRVTRANTASFKSAP